MANLRTAMDSAFWDQPVSSPETLDGCVRSVPSQAFPLEISRASRALRIQQLSILSRVFPLGIIPSISPTPHDPQLGSLAFQSSFLKLSLSNWWLGLVGQFRPKKLISSIKRDFFNGGSPEFKNVGKHVLDESLYSIGAYTQFSPIPSTSLLLSTERHGDKKTPRHKLMLYHQLRNHDITLEAAVPELFVDNRKATGYWDVPQSASLDVSSLLNKSGFVYRFGLHANAGHPESAVNTVDAEPPSALVPGLCGKVACSYQKSKDFWRIKCSKSAETRLSLPRPYDDQLKEPHSSLSGIIGATCAAWLIGEERLATPFAPKPRRRRNRNIPVPVPIPVRSSIKRSPVSADMFGSVCYTIQHGKFTKSYGDLTRLDARLDIFSAAALFSKGVFNTFQNSEGNPDNTLSSPRLNFIFQQQVAGPVVARVDSRFAVGGSSRGAHLEDVVYSMNYSLKAMRAAKVVAWYSPKRKEGMVELRVSEF